MISGPAASVRISTSSKTPAFDALIINGSNFQRLIPAPAAFDKRPASATLERRRVFSADSRKFFTAILLPVESTLDVTTPVFDARLAVACKAECDTDCCVGANAAAVDTITAESIPEKQENVRYMHITFCNVKSYFFGQG